MLRKNIDTTSLLFSKFNFIFNFTWNLRIFDRATNNFRHINELFRL